MSWNRRIIDTPFSRVFSQSGWTQAVRNYAKNVLDKGDMRPFWAFIGSAITVNYAVKRGPYETKRSQSDTQQAIARLIHFFLIALELAATPRCT